MPLNEHSDDCPGCRPVLFNARTNSVFAPDSPEMKLVNEVWAKTTLAQRKAWHAVTCQNSRKSEHLEAVRPFQEALGAAMESVFRPGQVGVQGSVEWDDQFHSVLKEAMPIALALMKERIEKSGRPVVDAMAFGLAFMATCETSGQDPVKFFALIKSIRIAAKEIEEQAARGQTAS